MNFVNERRFSIREEGKRSEKIVLDREKASKCSGEPECDEDHVKTPNTKILRNASQLLFADSRNSTMILLKTGLAMRKLIQEDQKDFVLLTFQFFPPCLKPFGAHCVNKDMLFSKKKNGPSISSYFKVLVIEV